MRYVLGFFPPDRLFALVDALAESHVHGLTISDARGFGQEHDPAHPEHREHLGVEMTKKIRVEIVCRDDEADALRRGALPRRPHGPSRRRQGLRPARSRRAAAQDRRARRCRARPAFRGVKPRPSRGVP